MAVEVYRSTDAGAPVLSGTTGTMNALLDAVLVDGYGSKPAVGWTKPFSDANTTVYRMPVGTSSGYYLQVFDDGAVNSNVSARVRAYETMSDVSTGTNAFPIESFANTFFHKSNAGNATPKEWMVVADTKFFYLLVEVNTQSVIIHCFGDLETLDPADPYPTFIHTNADTNPSSSNEDDFLSSETINRWCARAHDGGAIAQVMTTAKWDATGSTATVSGGSSQNAPYPDPYLGGFLMRKQDIKQNDPSSRFSFRGWLPGMYRIANNLDTSGQIWTWQDTFDIGSDQYVFMMNAPALTVAGTETAALIVTGDWF